jgi:K+-sensing histidine kinase KdpD
MNLKSVYRRVPAYVLAFGLVVFVAAGLGLLREVLDRTVVALLFLIPVGGITARWGLGPGITSALSGFLAFNYLFIAPY